MKKKLSFISGLTALVFFLLTFTTNAFASELTKEADTQASIPQEETIAIPDEQVGIEGESSDEGILEADKTAEHESTNEKDVVSEEDGLPEVEVPSRDELSIDTNAVVSIDTPAEEPTDEYDMNFEDEEMQELYDELFDALEDTGEDNIDLTTEVPDESGRVIVDHSNSEKSGLIYVLSHEDFASFLEENPDFTLVTKLNQVEMSIPGENFTPGNDFAIAILKDSSEFSGSLSNVYNFFLMYPNFDSEIEYDLEFVRTFTKPVSLKFFIDPTKVKNWDDVKVVYIDTNGEKKEFITPKSIDRETGEVIVEVSHFSKYGVFEVASTNTNNDNNNAGTDGSNNNGTGTTTTTPANNTTPTNTNTVANAVTKTNTGSTGTTAAGNQLPNTATNSYNILLLGLALFAVGSLFFVRKKGQAN